MSGRKRRRNRKEKSEGEKRGWREGGGAAEERKRMREKEERGGGEKKQRRIRARLPGRILLITRVLWGHETKRFPFNCVSRPVCVYTFRDRSLKEFNYRRVWQVSLFRASSLSLSLSLVVADLLPTACPHER